MDKSYEPAKADTRWKARIIGAYQVNFFGVGSRVAYRPTITKC